MTVVIVRAVSALLSGIQGSRAADRSPLQVLHERFARGAVDETECKRKRKVLER